MAKEGMQTAFWMLRYFPSMMLMDLYCSVIYTFTEHEDRSELLQEVWNHIFQLGRGSSELSERWKRCARVHVHEGASHRPFKDGTGCHYSMIWALMEIWMRQLAKLSAWNRKRRKVDVWSVMEILCRRQETTALSIPCKFAQNFMWWLQEYKTCQSGLAQEHTSLWSIMKSRRGSRRKF